ncbi:MAG: DoxX family membrane protein [Myxococcota bacterium]
MSSLSLWVAQTLAAAFLGILFLQSGLDKVLDWKGNKEWLTGYFAKSPLKRFPTFLLFNITVLEVAAGVVSAAGCLTVLLTRGSTIAFVGAVLSAVSVVSLFFGQRLAKDYAGAAGMVPYALFTIASVLLQGANL